MINQSHPMHGDTEYEESMHETRVVQKLADYADKWKGYREQDREIFLMLLKDAYHGIRRDGPHANDWDMDIN